MTSFDVEVGGTEGSHAAVVVEADDEAVTV
jgi:hypothetical protein